MVLFLAEVDSEDEAIKIVSRIANCRFDSFTSLGEEQLARGYVRRKKRCGKSHNVRKPMADITLLCILTSEESFSAFMRKGEERRGTKTSIEEQRQEETAGDRAGQWTGMGKHNQRNDYQIKFQSSLWRRLRGADGL